MNAVLEKDKGKKSDLYLTKLDISPFKNSKESVEMSSVWELLKTLPKVCNLQDQYYNEFITNIPLLNFIPTNNYIRLNVAGNILKIPTKLEYLLTEIKKSEYILKLEDDFDEMGSPAYLFETWRSSIDFLLEYATWIKENLGCDMLIPHIYHGPRGSIDILWEYDNFRMLLNIEKDGKTGCFYSDFLSTNQTSEGSFIVSEDINFQLFPVPINNI